MEGQERGRWHCPAGLRGAALRCNCTGLLHQSPVFLGESDSPATCRAAALINKKEEIIPKGSRGMHCIRTFARAAPGLSGSLCSLSVARRAQSRAVRGHCAVLAARARVPGAPGARGPWLCPAVPRGSLFPRFMCWLCDLCDRDSILGRFPRLSWCLF